MTDYNIEFFQREGYLESVSSGVLLSVEELMQSSDTIIGKALETNNHIVFMNIGHLVLSLTDKEVELIMTKVGSDLTHSFDLHYISVHSDVGSDSQKLFEQLAKKAGLNYELFKTREEALNRIEEIKKVSV